MTQSLPKSLSAPLTVLLGLAVGITVANLYYAQPLIALISSALTLDPAASGLILTLTQIGYGLGVLFIVPLGDLTENKRLILTMIGITVLGVLGLALSESIIPYFAAALLTGIGASAVQIIVPYAAGLTGEADRGRVVGNLMSGLMLGIMLSRPTASLLTDLFSWHAVFYLSAGLMIFLMGTLSLTLPKRSPPPLNMGYTKLIASMAHLFTTISLLRRRSIYQAFIFGAFCLFWTAVPLYLAGPAFHMSQTGIALFALAGVAGAVSAPFAGRLADRGYSNTATTIALLSASFSFLVPHLFPEGSTLALTPLVFSAILLDAGVSANLVVGQRAIFNLKPEYRSRLNGLYIATIFVGGGVGSSLGAWSYSHGGWMWTSWVGFLMPLAALLYFFSEFIDREARNARRGKKTHTELPVFTTSRLILRPIRQSDAESYQKYFSDREVIENLAYTVPWPYPQDGASAFIEAVLLPSQGHDRWAWGIFRKEFPDELIGCIDLWREGRPENRGFWLGRPFWGQGYMSEAVIPINDYAFDHLGFKTLIFSNARGNHRSHRVKEKTGARFTGYYPAKFVNPDLTEAESWELTAENWREWKKGHQSNAQAQGVSFR